MDVEQATITLPVQECGGWDCAHDPHVYDWSDDHVTRYCRGEGS